MRHHAILTAGLCAVLVPCANAQIEIVAAERIVEADLDTRFVTNALGEWSAAADAFVLPGQGPLDGAFSATQDSRLFNLPNPSGDEFEQGFFGNSFVGTYIFADDAGFAFNYSNSSFSYLESSFVVSAPVELRIEYFLIADAVPGGESLAQFVLSDPGLNVIESRIAEGTPNEGGELSGFVDLTLQPGSYVLSSLASVDFAFDESLVAEGFFDARANFSVTIIPGPASLALFAAAALRARRRR